MPRRYHYTKKTGRPTKYHPTYCQKLRTFFRRRTPYRTINEIAREEGVVSRIRQANDPPLLVDFARTIKVHLATLYDWEKAHPQFHEALEEARALQEKYYVTCGVLGLTNPTITALILKNNHGYKDREDASRVPDGTPVPRIAFIVNVQGTATPVALAPSDATSNGR